MRKTIAIAALAGLAAAASAQTVTFNFNGVPAGPVDPNSTWTIGVSATVSGFTPQTLSSLGSSLVVFTTNILAENASIGNFELSSTLLGAGFEASEGDTPEGYNYSFFVADLGAFPLQPLDFTAPFPFPTIDPHTFDLFTFDVTVGDLDALITFLPPTGSATITASTAAGELTEASATGSFGITVIPTPGTAALVGLGGIAALRRRR